MLFSVITHAIKTKRARENYDEKDKKVENIPNNSNVVDDNNNLISQFHAFGIVFSVGLILLELVLGVWAAVLSFKSNRFIGWGAAPSVLFAIFAFLFNILYLLTHLICKCDIISFVRKQNQTIQQFTVAVQQPIVAVQQPIVAVRQPIVAVRQPPQRLQTGGGCKSMKKPKK